MFLKRFEVFQYLYVSFLESGLFTRNMAAQLFSIQVTDGPFVLLKSDKSVERVTCSLQLIDYDNSVPFDKKIVRVIGEKKEQETNGGVKEKLNIFFIIVLLFASMCPLFC